MIEKINASIFSNQDPTNYNKNSTNNNEVLPNTKHIYDETKTIYLETQMVVSQLMTKYNNIYESLANGHKTTNTSEVPQNKNLLNVARTSNNSQVSTDTTIQNETDYIFTSIWAPIKSITVKPATVSATVTSIEETDKYQTGIEKPSDATKTSTTVTVSR